jgi:TetR/AcrR family transcriptional repressor of nem operon
MPKADTPEKPDDKPSVRDHIVAVGRRIMAGKGFSAVGLNEILTEAKVPKGSFYHYFASKDAFGVALLSSYFDEQLADVDAILAEPGLTMAQRVLRYFDMWRANQSFADGQGRCLAVKLAAEVADLSEPMRIVLDRGTSAIIDKLAAALASGAAEGSLAIGEAPRQAARNLYQLWLGASIMVKIGRDTAPLDGAMAVTRCMLGLHEAQPPQPVAA